MDKLRSLLELYGCLDKVVLESDAPEMAAAVDQLLPAASANTGWYREIEHFCYGGHPGGARDDADPIRALNTLADHGDTLKPYEKLRLLYGVAAIARVQSVPATGPLPYLKKDKKMKDAVARALAHLGPADISYADHLKTTTASIGKIVGHLETTTGRRSWPKVTREMVDNKWIAPEVADEPLCKTAVVSVDGVKAVVIDTNFTSNKLSLDSITAIADPRNWDEDYHEFFADIKALPPRSDGWGRFLETVEFGTDALRLVTELKYLKTSPDCTRAILDYDLNDPWPGAGDGLVTVDRGFIDMRATGKSADKGVQVRTRKVVHITGLSPAAQARLVCISGYGTASKEFLLGAAAKPPPKAVPWKAPVGGKDRSEEGGAKPAEPPSYIATAAFKVWNDCVQEVMTRNLDISEKWLDGALNFTDLANYSKDVSGLLLTAPWEFLAAINQPRYAGNQPNQTRRRGPT
jgi:hypothetical protein